MEEIYNVDMEVKANFAGNKDLEVLKERIKALIANDCVIEDPKITVCNKVMYEEYIYYYPNKIALFKKQVRKEIRSANKEYNLRKKAKFIQNSNGYKFEMDANTLIGEIFCGLLLLINLFIVMVEYPNKLYFIVSIIGILAYLFGRILDRNLCEKYVRGNSKMIVCINKNYDISAKELNRIFSKFIGEEGIFVRIIFYIPIFTIILQWVYLYSNI